MIQWLVRVNVIAVRFNGFGEHRIIRDAYSGLVEDLKDVPNKLDEFITSADVQDNTVVSISVEPWFGPVD